MLLPLSINLKEEVFMLSGISNSFGTDMQAASAVICTSLGLLAGRKICLAVVCKLVGTVEDWAGMQNADAWKQAADEYMALAKTDTFRDVAAVAGFVGAVALTRYAEKSLTVQEEKPKPEEPGYLESYGVPALKYGAVLGAGLLLRKPLIKPVVGYCANSSPANKLMEKLEIWNDVAVADWGSCLERSTGCFMYMMRCLGSKY